MVRVLPTLLKKEVMACDLKDANWDYIDEGEVFKPVDGDKP